MLSLWDRWEAVSDKWQVLQGFTQACPCLCGVIFDAAPHIECLLLEQAAIALQH